MNGSAQGTGKHQNSNFIESSYATSTDVLHVLRTKPPTTLSGSVKKHGDFFSSTGIVFIEKGKKTQDDSRNQIMREFEMMHDLIARANRISAVIVGGRPSALREPNR